MFFLLELSMSNSFTVYIGVPVFLVLYFSHWLTFWHDPWAWRSEDDKYIDWVGGGCYSGVATLG